LVGFWTCIGFPTQENEKGGLSLNANHENKHQNSNERDIIGRSDIQNDEKKEKYHRQPELGIRLRLSDSIGNASPL